MTCYYPIAALQAIPGGPLTLFKREQKHLYRGQPGKHLEVPCGQCSGCRRRRSLEWAMRCMHEKQLHAQNAYITLTYRTENLPLYNSLQHRHYVLFAKALRHKVGPHRFYMGGEYGTLHGRPHYHSLLFGLDFADKIYHGRSQAGERLYTSPTLEKIWKHGYSSIGEVTFNSAAYVARYIMKKRTGDNLPYYEILDPETGELWRKQKEYNCMSRNPGIGKTWWDQYKNDVIHGDYVITTNGRKLNPPRYYDKQLKRYDLALYEHTKHARELEALAHETEHTTERLAVQEIVANDKARKQTRNLE